MGNWIQNITLNGNSYNLESSKEIGSLTYLNGFTQLTPRNFIVRIGKILLISLAVQIPKVDSDQWIDVVSFSGIDVSGAHDANFRTVSTTPNISGSTTRDCQILPSQKRVLMFASDKDNGESVWIQGFTYYE